MMMAVMVGIRENGNLNRTVIFLGYIISSRLGDPASFVVVKTINQIIQHKKAAPQINRRTA